MKAIWLNHGVLTDIVVNGACSAGAARSSRVLQKPQGVAVEDMRPRGIFVQSPAVLGSRCTVFMNSSVVSEQRR